MVTTEFSFLSAQEAAEALNVTDARIRQLLLAGEMKGYKLGERNWAVDPDEIKKYQKSRRAPGRKSRKS